MIFGWLQQEVVDLLRVVLPNQSLEGECMCAYVPETMQLVEDGYIVDFAGFRWLSRFQVPLLTSVVGQEDEAVTLRAKASIPTKMLNPMIQRLSLPCRSQSMRSCVSSFPDSLLISCSSSNALTLLRPDEHEMIDKKRRYRSRSSKAVAVLCLAACNYRLISDHEWRCRRQRLVSWIRNDLTHVARTYQKINASCSGLSQQP
ncbi:hypothetical protein KC337_g27 [Hortaea werneckii]|nr:hypothetical protein KC337_g27 [Hortaea werneckii]